MCHAAWRLEEDFHFILKDKQINLFQKPVKKFQLKGVSKASDYYYLLFLWALESAFRVWKLCCRCSFAMQVRLPLPPTCLCSFIFYWLWIWENGETEWRWKEKYKIHQTLVYISLHILHPTQTYIEASSFKLPGEGKPATIQQQFIARKLCVISFLPRGAKLERKEVKGLMNVYHFTAIYVHSLCSLRLNSLRVEYVYFSVDWVIMGGGVWGVSRPMFDDLRAHFNYTRRSRETRRRLAESLILTFYIRNQIKSI